MLYIIGLGLNEKSISLEALEAIKKCGRVYLENYTIEFPYSLKDLEKVIGKKIVSLNREKIEGIEGEKFIKEAKKENICLLVYGSPLFATTHIILIEECKNKKIKFKIIYNAGIFDAIGETGLQLYKFGRITSMPKWQENFKADSFINIIKENEKTNSHSLILVDLGLDFKKALKQLDVCARNKKLKLDKILVCSRLGTTDSKVYYGEIGKLQKTLNKVKGPFCFIIPGKMHFMEEEILKRFFI